MLALYFTYSLKCLGNAIRTLTMKQIIIMEVLCYKCLVIYVACSTAF